MKISKASKLLGLFMFTSLVTACGGGSHDIDNPVSYDAKMTFVNATDDMTDFYVKKTNSRSRSDSVYEGKYRKGNDVAMNDVGGTYNHKYDIAKVRVVVAISDSNSNTDQVQVNKRVDDGDKWWVIAWQDGIDKALTIAGRKSNNRADEINVRILADDNYDIVVEGDSSSSTQAGQVTGFFSVESCSTGLEVGGNTIDLCDANYGQSYLLVVDADGKRLMVRE
ncbi:hypothetical protein HR060_05275 [Catenovulum sp. SM1970]|uniref:hypothetical protein n=1 Tax=Marinifaba aquimaris TaxID=2741323 RepID=UPI001571C994|nr:hypothetical protein [Marinifaba aquimaris]NTS76274.1 hypothetical protein [Marinifaba aquimaris]